MFITEATSNSELNGGLANTPYYVDNKSYPGHPFGKLQELACIGEEVGCTDEVDVEVVRLAQQHG